MPSMAEVERLLQGSTNGSIPEDSSVIAAPGVKSDSCVDGTSVR
jgi:hypothetical protein